MLIPKHPKIEKKLNINLDNNENTKEEEEKREARKLAENDIDLI